MCLLILIPFGGCDSTKLATTSTNTAGLPFDQRTDIVAPPGGNADAESWRQRVFYEVWVRALQDTDGDGVGDFKGLISRLPQLASLGIGGLWLMPTFPSPLVDSGYDVANYRDVHPDYGTLEDLQELLDAAHKENMLVYLDMVFNHTSDQHDWFKSALTGPDSPYYDYYVWADAPSTKCTDIPTGPFGSQRWQYVKELDKYYFHQFYPRQPDLNFRNPQLRQELLDVLQYWMDRGVDGFRFDVPDRFYENGNHCSHQPETLAFHGDLKQTISGKGKVQRGHVSEIWGLYEQNLPFFGPKANPMIFSLHAMLGLYSAVGVGQNPDAIANAINVTQIGLPSASRHALILGNHDLPRFASVASNNLERLRLAVNLQMSLPGVPFMWMGDELGLSNGQAWVIDWRDVVRSPYPWNKDEVSLGFSENTELYLPMTVDSVDKTFNAQDTDSDSLLNWYRTIISLRNDHVALNDGDYTEIYRDSQLWAYKRSHEKETIVVVHNFSRTEAVLVPQSVIPASCIELLSQLDCSVLPVLQPSSSYFLSHQ